MEDLISKETVPPTKEEKASATEEKNLGKVTKFHVVALLPSILHIVFSSMKHLEMCEEGTIVM